MQQLSVAEQNFIDRRRRLMLRWPPVLLVMLVALGAGWLYLYFRHPALANTAYVIEAVRAGTLTNDVMQMSALFLPLVITVLFFVMVALLLFLHLTIRNERRYQAIIRSLRQSPP